MKTQSESKGVWSSLLSVFSFSSTRHRDVHWGDRIFLWILRFVALGLVALLVAVFVYLFKTAHPALSKFGFQFLTKTTWDPVQENFGALPVIYGTLVSSFLALLISTPISVGIALFLTEMAPPSVSKTVSFLVEMLAAIPSVVYGLWGIFVLAPLLRMKLEPFLANTLGGLPLLGKLFSGPPYGVGMLSAGIILSIMITPTITSIAKEVFKTIPRVQREAALALGATRAETMSLSVLKSAHSGVMGAVILGLGRALGETMAVTMVIGNRSDISASLFAPGQTMASVIANEYAEAVSSMHLSALAAVGFVLLILTFLVNSIARFLVWRIEKRVS